LAIAFDSLMIFPLLKVVLGWYTALTQARLSPVVVDAFGYVLFLAPLMYHVLFASRVRFRTPGEIIVGVVPSDVGPRMVVRNPFRRSRSLLFVCAFLMLVQGGATPEIPLMQMLVGPPELAQLVNPTLLVPLFLFAATGFASGSMGWAVFSLAESVGQFVRAPGAPRLFHGALLLVTFVTIAVYRRSAEPEKLLDLKQAGGSGPIQQPD